MTEQQATDSKRVNDLLKAATSGHRQSQEEFVKAIHVQLRRMASFFMSSERTGHTLQPTALVNEVFTRLPDWQSLDLENKTHFFTIASRIMREILVDYARKHNTQKRGQGQFHCSLDNALAVAPENIEQALILDEVLHKLEELDPRQGKVVELRLFAGLSLEDIAEILRLSVHTVKKEWRIARVWLALQLEGSEARSAGNHSL